MEALVMRENVLSRVLGLSKPALRTVEGGPHRSVRRSVCWLATLRSYSGCSIGHGSWRSQSQLKRRVKGGMAFTASMVSVWSPAKLSYQALSSILEASSQGQKAKR